MRPDFDSIFTRGTTEIELLGKRWQRTQAKNQDSALRLYIRKGTKVFPSYEDVEKLYWDHLVDVISRWMSRMVRRRGWVVVNKTWVEFEPKIPLNWDSDWITEFRAKQKVIRDPEYLRYHRTDKIVMVPDDMYTLSYVKAPKELPKAVWISD